MLTQPGMTFSSPGIGTAVCLLLVAGGLYVLYKLWNEGGD